MKNQQRSRPMDLDRLQLMVDKLAQSLCQNLCDQPAEHCSKNEINAICKRATLSIVFTSNRNIRKLNRQWRHKDYDTDVLSFPLSLEPPISDMPWEIGEIFLSVEKAAEQAKSYNHTLDRELAFLCVHGMLHILGFDHEQPDEEKEMFQRQKAILKAAGFPRQ